MKIDFAIDDIKNIDECKELHNAFLDILNENPKSIDGNIFKRCNDIIYNYTKIYKNVFLEQKLTPSELYKVKECIVAARRFYKESIDERNELKLLIALCLLRFYGQSFSFFSDISLSDEFIEIIHKLLINISIGFIVQDDASYKEHKRFAVYNEIKEKSDFSSILRMMDELGNSPYIFERLNCSWGIFFKWIWFINHDFVFEFLEATTPETTEAVFWSLKEEILTIVENYHSEKNYYPTLRGFMFLFHFYEEKLQKHKYLTPQELPDCSDWLIHVLHDDCINVVHYINSMRITHLKSFNHFLGKAVAKNSSLIEIYLKIADMDYEPSHAFSEACLEFIENEQSILQLGQRIVKEYFDFHIDFHDKINKETGYLNLIAIYFSKKYNTREKYLEKLTEVAAKIVEIQNSWNFEKITNNWTLLFYLALANNIMNFSFSKEELQDCIPVLFDKREEVIYEKNYIDAIRKLLSSKLEEVILSNQYDDVKVVFKKYPLN